MGESVTVLRVLQRLRRIVSNRGSDITEFHKETEVSCRTVVHFVAVERTQGLKLRKQRGKAFRLPDVSADMALPGV